MNYLIETHASALIINYTYNLESVSNFTRILDRSSKGLLKQQLSGYTRISQIYKQD
jgi:hypothetical protein